MPEFVEFSGKKDYKCPRCKAPIRYAKFFGDNKKILTTDGKEPYFDKDRKPMSNTGWPTDPNTKQMHECKKEIEVIDREDIQYGKDKTTLQPKQFPESELKKSNTLDSGWGDNSENTANSSSITVVHNSQTELTELDKKVRDSIIQKAYDSSMLLIFKLQGVEKACKDLGIEIGQVSGMIFKETCAEDRSLKEHE